MGTKLPGSKGMEGVMLASISRAPPPLAHPAMVGLGGGPLEFPGYVRVPSMPKRWQHWRAGAK